MSDGCSGKPQFDSWFWLRDRLTDRLRSATPVMIEDTLLPFDLPSVARKKLSVGFDGGQLSSDAGVLVLRGVEKKLGLAARLAACIRDRRKPERIEHPLEEMLRLRMFAIAAGYEDADDCDSLRYDPIFKMAVGHAPESGDPLCSQPTMSRLENAPSKIEIARLMAALVDGFCDSYRRAPSSITLDIDDICDMVHGHQQLSLFNAHYDERCFLPIHIYEARGGRRHRRATRAVGQRQAARLQGLSLRRKELGQGAALRGAHRGNAEGAGCALCRHLAQGRRQASLRDPLLRAGKRRELHQAAQEPARFRPHLLPRSQSQPVPLDPAHRGLLAHACHAQRRARTLAAVPRRVRHDAPSPDQDRCARRGGGCPHPCLSAHGMPRSRRLPRTRRTVLRRRTVAIAALSPHRALRRNLQPVKIKSSAAASLSSDAIAATCVPAKVPPSARNYAILGE